MAYLSKALVVGAIVLFAAGLVVAVIRQPQQQSNQQQVEQKANVLSRSNDGSPPKSFLQWVVYWWTGTSDPIAYFTGWLAILSALLVVVAVIQIFLLLNADKTATVAAGAAQKAADVAERALVAGNRPWIKADIQVGGPITYNVNGANITLRFILKNVGHSPATNVFVNPRVISPFASLDGSGAFDPRAELKKDIAGLKQRAPSPFGFAMFPDDTIIQDVIVTIPQDDLKRATKMIGAIYPTVLGAIDYRMGFDDKSHLTGFILEVRRSDTPRPATTEKNRSPSAIWLDEGDVPAADIRLIRSFIEGGYAD